MDKKRYKRADRFQGVIYDDWYEQTIAEIQYEDETDGSPSGDDDDLFDATDGES